MAVISLIGMSGTGKTFWSTRFAAAGWQRICCDDLIEVRLHRIMPIRQPGIAAVADWLGQPHDVGYAERQQRYLDAEIAVVEETITAIEREPTLNYVVDTTGSVIYTGEALCQRLRQVSRVVYIALPATAMAEMVQRYLSDPKPVLWMDQFQHTSQHSLHDTITTCYPKLIELRAKLYERYAHVTLPYTKTSAPDFTLEQFLHAVL